MNPHRFLSRREWLALASAGLALPGLARAQAWPSKAIRFVVPFAPGGSSEIVARTTAVELGKALGQSVYVDNKPGGAGNVAMQEVARADDQHTLILGHIGTLAVNPYIFEKLSFDVNKDFKPVSLLAKVPSLYLVRPDLPVKNIKELVAYAKKNPGKLNYASSGNGGALHLATELMLRQMGTRGIAVDSANLYYAHSTLGSISQVPLAGGPTLTLASSQASPWAVTVNGGEVFWSSSRAMANGGRRGQG